MTQLETAHLIAVHWGTPNPYLRGLGTLAGASELEDLRLAAEGDGTMIRTLRKENARLKEENARLIMMLETTYPIV